MKNALLFLLAIGCGAWAAAADTPRHPVAYSAVTPVLDGRIEGDPAWESAPWSGGFIRFKVREAPRNQTRFKALYTRDALYVAAECMESGMDRLKPEVNFGEFWLYDVLEVFCIPAPNELIHLILSAAGSTFDVIPGNVGKRTTYQLGWKGASDRAGDRWTAEFCIPFFLLGAGPGEAGLGLPFNLCRYSTPAKEFSTWSFQPSSYRQREGFGELSFQPPPADVRQAVARSLERPHWISLVRRWGEIRNDPAWAEVLARHPETVAALERLYAAPESYAEQATAFAEAFEVIEQSGKAGEVARKRAIRRRLFDE